MTGHVAAAWFPAPAPTLQDKQVCVFGKSADGAEAHPHRSPLVGRRGISEGPQLLRRQSHSPVTSPRPPPHPELVLTYTRVTACSRQEVFI